MEDAFKKPSKRLFFTPEACEFRIPLEPCTQAIYPCCPKRLARLVNKRMRSNAKLTKIRAGQTEDCDGE